MGKTRITVHLPAHRRAALHIERDTSDAAQAYDQYIGEYLQFLRDEAERAGYALGSDHQDNGGIFTIDEIDHAGKKAAHDWLHTQPDIWNWIP